MPADEKSKQPARVNITNKILDPDYPVPIQYGGDSFAVVNNNKKYIPFIGRDNNLPNLLLEARLTSPTQDTCISTVASSVIGNGLSVLGIEPQSIDSQFAEWIKCVNNDQDTFDDVLYDVIEGEREQGNQFIEVTRGDVGGKTFMKVYCHPFQYCRFAELEKGQLTPSAVVITKMFAKRGHRIRIDDARVIPLWSPNPLDQAKCWVKDPDGTLRTMLHFKNKRAGIDYYGLPASISGLRYQIAEGLLIQYNNDDLENNMIIGGMLKIKSAMTQPEALATAESIMAAHIGKGKTSRIAVISSENGLGDVEFEKFDTKKEGSFLELDKAIERKIIGTHGWHKLLAGLDDGGGSLGNGNNYIRSIWYDREAQLLNPLRRRLTDKVVVPLMKIFSDVYSNQAVLKYSFWFNSAMPFSFLGDVLPELYTQVNEAREAAGLIVDNDKKGVYLADMKKGQQPADLTSVPKPSNGKVNV